MGEQEEPEPDEEPEVAGRGEQQVAQPRQHDARGTHQRELGTPRRQGHEESDQEGGHEQRLGRNGERFDGEEQDREVHHPDDGEGQEGPVSCHPPRVRGRRPFAH